MNKPAPPLEKVIENEVLVYLIQHQVPESEVSSKDATQIARDMAEYLQNDLIPQFAERARQTNTPLKEDNPMMELVKDNVKVELEDIGEGLSGDYDEENPEDVALLRFSVYVMTNPKTGERITREQLKANPKLGKNPDWEAVDDASYCTQLPVEAEEAELKTALTLLMENYHDALADGPDVSVKKMGERLSWISLDEVREYV